MPVLLKKMYYLQLDFLKKESGACPKQKKQFYAGRSKNRGQRAKRYSFIF